MAAADDDAVVVVPALVVLDLDEERVEAPLPARRHEQVDEGEAVAAGGAERLRRGARGVAARTAGRAQPKMKSRTSSRRRVSLPAGLTRSSMTVRSSSVTANGTTTRSCQPPPRRRSNSAVSGWEPSKWHVGSCRMRPTRRGRTPWRESRRRLGRSGSCGSGVHDIWTTSFVCYTIPALDRFSPGSGTRHAASAVDVGSRSSAMSNLARLSPVPRWTVPADSGQIAAQGPTRT